MIKRSKADSIVESKYSRRFVTLVSLVMLLCIFAGMQELHAEAAEASGDIPVAAGMSGDMVFAAVAEEGVVIAAATETEDQSDVVTRLISWLKDQVAEGTLNTKEDVQAAIEAGEDKFGVTLSESMKDTLVNLISEVQELGLDPDFLLDQADELYAEYGEDIGDHTEEAFFQVAFAAVKDFFTDLIHNIVDFFVALFS